MSWQLLVIVISRFAPVLLAAGLTAVLGLEKYGVLRLYLADASLAVGIMFAGFAQAYVAHALYRESGRPVPGAWVYIIIATPLAAIAVVLFGSTSSISAAVCMVGVVVLVNSAEARSMFQRRPINSAATTLFGMTVLNLVYWAAAFWASSVSWIGDMDHAVLFAACFTVCSLLGYHIFFLRNKEIIISSDALGRNIFRELFCWIRWQAEYMAGASALVFYVNFVPVLLGHLYGPSAVAIATLSISVGTLFSFVPTRFLQINLSMLRSGGDDQPFGLQRMILRNLARVRLISVVGGVIVLIVAMSFSEVLGIDPNLRWVAIGYLLYPLASTFVGPCGIVLAQIGRPDIVRQNAALGCGIFLLMVCSVAVFLPNNQMAFGICYLLGRVGNDLLNARSLRRFTNGQVSMSILGDLRYGK